MWHTDNKKLPSQHLVTMAIDKICKMTVKGVKLYQKVSFQYLMAFWRKTLRGRIPPPPPGLDRVKRGNSRVFFEEDFFKKEYKAAIKLSPFE